MKNTIFKLLTIPLAFSLLNPAWGQSIEETLQDLIEGNAKGYLSPLVTAFGTGMNSGTFHRAKPHKVLGFDVTLNLSVTIIPNSDLEYEFFLSDKLLPLTIPLPTGDVDINLAISDLYQTGVKVSTCFGDNTEVPIPVNTTGAYSAIVSEVAAETDLSETDVETLAGTEITNIVNSLEPLKGPPGINIPLWPTVMPQVSVGLPFHTELTLRGFKIETPEGDPISFFGFGAKVYLNQFIPTIPLVFPAISVGYYATNLNMGDFIKANNSILTLQVSKSVPVITVYGGFGIENSSITVDLKDETDEQILDFSLDGDNSFRTIVGLRLKLAVLSLHVDYNIGEYPAINAGIGLTIR